MGREVRRVPKDWEHPKNDAGNYVPLFDGFNRRLKNWEEGAAKWAEGLRSDFHGGWQAIEDMYKGESYEEWDGEKPDPKDYMPDWPEAERTHWQMYEDTTEGTPISPVMESPEELAKWLADNGASAFGGMTATYQQWLATINRGWTPSAVIADGKMVSGVEHEGMMDRYFPKKDV